MIQYETFYSQARPLFPKWELEGLFYVRILYNISINIENVLIATTTLIVTNF